MQEVVTEAIVLDIRSFSNFDRQVDLLTKDLGRIKAHVQSGSKPKSKLSPHLDRLNLVDVRLFEKNRFTVTDVLTKHRFDSIRGDVSLFSKALDVLFLIQSTFPEEIPDLNLWRFLLVSLQEGKLEINKFLEILGYSPRLAPCFKCKEKKENRFFVPDQIFVCKECSEKMPEDLLINVS